MTKEERVVRVTISGRVQGVCYRAWTIREATARGIRGWVRNRLNGDVEALFAGPPDAVEALCADCWHGPPGARVDKVEVAGCGAELRGETGTGPSFRQIATR